MDTMPALPQHELPMPEVSRANTAGDSKEGFGDLTPELRVAPAPGERIMQANSAVAQAAAATPALPVDPAAGSAVTTSNLSQGVSTSTDDSTKEIEKAMVIKAKQIVHQTQGDPYALSYALAGLRHEYITKRFGRDTVLKNQPSKAA